MASQGRCERASASVSTDVAAAIRLFKPRQENFNLISLYHDPVDGKAHNRRDRPSQGIVFRGSEQ
jgi:hypothetical protein